MKFKPQDVVLAKNDSTREEWEVMGYGNGRNGKPNVKCANVRGGDTAFFLEENLRIAYPYGEDIFVLEDRIQELEAALRPLARCAATSMLPGANPDNQFIYGPQSSTYPQPKGISLADVFRARRAFDLPEDEVPCLDEDDTFKDAKEGAGG